MQRRRFSREFKIEAVKRVGCQWRKRAATWGSMRTCCANG
jgi:hypothetical protein